MTTFSMRAAAATFTVAFASGAFAAPFEERQTDRTMTPLTGDWKFTASNSLTGAEAPNYPDASWTTVTVPHTWNSADDAENTIADFGNAWYRKAFTVPVAPAGRRTYVVFEGAFQVADVYLNGTYLGQHRGGYTRFVFDATRALKPGAPNLLAVKLSNKDCADCLPDKNTRLWKGYGGIYRKVWLLTTNSYHVATTHYASRGVYVTPSNVGAASADVSIDTMVTNDGAARKTFTVKNFIADQKKNVVLMLQRNVVVEPNTTMRVTQKGRVPTPRLWGRHSPDLYIVYATVWVDGGLTDVVKDRAGFRRYRLSENDFQWNGQSEKLRGVSKHQETEYRATAVSDADLAADWHALDDLGVNFVRLAHYPHAEIEYDRADELGIAIWAENGHTNGAAATANGEELTRAMIFQNWNHPSIFFWSIGNEARGVAASARYAAVAKATDASRPVVYASNGQSPAGVDFVWKNNYAGWYGGSIYDFLGLTGWISESGAGMVVGTHAPNLQAMNHRVDNYEPEEYGQLANEVKFQSLFVTHPGNIPAFSNWVFRDFGDVKYKNHVNTKGLLTFAGHRKDIYYLYKAFLKAGTESVVHVAGSDYFLRGPDGEGGDVKVYSNAPRLTLTVNGRAVGSLENGSYTHANGFMVNNVFVWSKALVPGRNTVTAADEAGLSHTVTLYFAPPGTALPDIAEDKITRLASDDALSPAVFIGRELLDQSPFYANFDGTADNSFDTVPPLLKGANGWIATRRQREGEAGTGVAFDLTADADVFVMFTRGDGSIPAYLNDAGFTDTGVGGKWRDNAMKLVEYRLFRRHFPRGARVTLAGSVADRVVIIK